MHIATDTGGTFTDLVLETSDGSVRLYKAPTVPDDPAAGVLDALNLAAESMGRSVADLLDECELFMHGTTHAINAVITGRTARTAFLTTEGHPDILGFREGGRIEPFNFTVPFPPPYVPRKLTFEVEERIDPQGEIVTPLNEAVLRRTIARLKEEQVEAVAVCLLWSITNPVHELRVADMLAEELPDVPVTLSHQLNPTLREYRRASSTAIDVSLKPLMSRYLGGLEQRLVDAGFRGRLLVLTSQGGALEAAALAEAPIHAINSGPSMAPVAGRHYGRGARHRGPVIVADTGGTTYDVSLVRGDTIPWSRETWIGEPYRGHMTGFPSIDIHSVGAGGGSIAWIDSGGVLHVGPQSAGAVPGPVCYDQGGELPTVTDAALVLGYVDPDFFLGGSISLNLEKAMSAIEKHVAGPLGQELQQAAQSIMDVVTENMVQAIEAIAVDQGIDPAESLLIGGGGAAGLNSVFIARRLGCRQVCFPDTGAALSAAGALISELRNEFRILHFTTSEGFDFNGVAATLDKLLSEARNFADNATGTVGVNIELFAEARYPSQVWEIEVPLRGEKIASKKDVAVLTEDFHRVHKELFAFADDGSEIEIVSWCAKVSCALRERDIGRLEIEDAVREGRSATRLLHLPDGHDHDTPVHNLTEIEVDIIHSGPAIIETPHTSIIIDDRAKFRRTPAGSLLVDID